MGITSLNSLSDGNKYSNPNKERRFINGYFEIGGKRIEYLNSRFNSRTDLQSFEQIDKIASYISPKINQGEISGSDTPSDIETPRRDSMLSYVEVIKDGTITPDQMGKFNVLATDYIMNYPDFISYDEFTQFRIGMSLPYMLGIVDKELPYRKIYDTYKKYKPASNSSPSSVVKKLAADGVINAQQTNYINGALDIINKNIASYVNEDINMSPLNVAAIHSGLDNLIAQIQNDKNLSKEQRLPLVYALTSSKHMATAINNIVSIANNGTSFSEGNRSGARGGGFFNGIGDLFNGFFNHWNPCVGCMFAYLIEIVSDSIYIFAIALVIIGAIYTGEGLGAPEIIYLLSGIVASIGATVDTILNMAKHCAIPCNFKKSDFSPCTNCPDDVYTRYDGANCMYGWYAGQPYSPCPAFIVGYAFDYCPYGSPYYSHCTDGNITTPFWLPGLFVRNPASSGLYDGAHCVFGWWDPGWTPFISGVGFYVKPKC